MPSGPEILGTAGASAERVADAWAKGAAGVRATAAVLAQLPSGWVVLHDLKIPQSDANIDHVVIGPTGVRVISTTANEGTYVNRDGMLWSGRDDLRDKIDKVEWMSGIVRQSVGVPADPVLCFVNATLPRPAQMIERARVVRLEALHDLLTAGPQVFSPDQVRRMAIEAQNLEEPHPAPPPLQFGPPVRPESPAPRLVLSPTPAPRSRPSRRRAKQSLLAVLVEIVLGLIILAVASNALLSKASKTHPTPEPRAVPVVAACRHPGTGWSVEFAWPGSTVGLTGYQVTLILGEARLDLGRWANEAGVHTPIDGLAPGTFVAVDAVAVTTSGNSEIARSTVTVPTTPC